MEIVTQHHGFKAQPLLLPPSKAVLGPIEKTYALQAVVTEAPLAEMRTWIRQARTNSGYVDEERLPIWTSTEGQQNLIGSLHNKATAADVVTIGTTLQGLGLENWLLPTDDVLLVDPAGRRPSSIIACLQNQGIHLGFHTREGSRAIV